MEKAKNVNDDKEEKKMRRMRKMRRLRKRRSTGKRWIERERKDAYCMLLCPEFKMLIA